MRFFLPKQPIFSELFKQLNACIKESAIIFNEFSSSFSDFEKYFVKIEDVEHRADDITHEIVNQLNKTFITPFDREDIYSLAQEMDDIIDLITHAVHTTVIYKLGEKKFGVDKFASMISRSSAELDKLVKDCFEKQKISPQVNSWVVKIHEIEDEADYLYQKCLRQLFEEENDAKMIIKWKDIYLNLEDVLDAFQSTSDTIESMIVKSS